MKLLAIDGGGIRGIYASHILERIQVELDVLFHEEFDLIAGTSTGAIIAASLAFGIPVKEVTDLYKTQGHLIFKRKAWSFGGKLFAKYSSEHLRSVLVGIFGDATLSDAKTRLIIPATDIGDGGVHVFKSFYDERFVRDKNVLVVDAILASCSAPAYFPPAIVGPYRLADGGLWANNPSLVAITEALTRLNVDRGDIRLLSIGTGVGRNYYPLGQDKKMWGFLTGWGVAKFISMILNLQASTATNVTKLLLEKNQFLRINFESDNSLDLDDLSLIEEMLRKADKDFTYNAEAIKDMIGDVR